MAVRHKWEFPYRASDVATSALKRTKYHEDRLKYWTAEKERSDKEGREEPEEEEEFHPKAYSNTRAVQNSRSADCAVKIMQHEEAILKLRLYARALEAHSTSNYNLDAEDVDFFGL